MKLHNISQKPSFGSYELYYGYPNKGPYIYLGTTYSTTLTPRLTNRILSSILNISRVYNIDIT